LADPEQVLGVELQLKLTGRCLVPSALLLGLRRVGLGELVDGAIAVGVGNGRNIVGLGKHGDGNQ
jgi:hypothetical protein